MRFLIIILAIICSCTNNSQKASPDLHQETNILDSIRIKSNVAWILFHHPIQKKSLVSKMVYTREGIDSLFKYIGQPSIDTNCLQAGLYNHFGQISLYQDSLRNKKIADIHFVLEGNCAGFYLKTENYLNRYDLTPQGVTFISELRKVYKP